MANASAFGSGWEAHDHDPIVHSHVHYHVTHNFRELTGGFEHLSSAHDHDHAHAPMTHRHYPHHDFEQEHGGEPHVHGHVQPAHAFDGAAGVPGDGNRRKAPARRSQGVSRRRVPVLPAR